MTMHVSEKKPKKEELSRKNTENRLKTSQQKEVGKSVTASIRNIFLHTRLNVHITISFLKKSSRAVLQNV